MSIPIFYGGATTFNYNFYNKNEQELLEEQLVINNQFYYEIPKEPLFEKLLTPSDVGKLNRLVIPKQHAERNFPMDGDRGNGIMLSFEDEVGKLWSFRYSYWGSSQSFVLTKGWSGYVKEKGLDAGDSVLFGRHRDGGRLFIGWRRKNGEVSGGGWWSRHGGSSSAYCPRTGGSGNPKKLRLFGVNMEWGSEPSAQEGSSTSSQGRARQRLRGQCCASDRTPLFFDN
ncbi:hypothetical protein CDL12_11231 [Handroanthus impetiginosus]|uniref:TF-B3 domain-containing protein n=1 Tax=Handroanthus impetiginosus TaxID=429701 RepID=A0A2G9HF08_9LAMI|nr:hypothetical protein CDL12_11231 [Handroanthus impetiginosus]